MSERSDHAIRCDVCGYSNGGTCNLRCACAPRRSPIGTAYDDRDQANRDYDALTAEVVRLRGLLRVARSELAVAASYVEEPGISIGLRTHACACAAAVKTIDAALVTK